MINLQVQENSAERSSGDWMQRPEESGQDSSRACLRARELHEWTDRAMAEAAVLKDRS